MHGLHALERNHLPLLQAAGGKMQQTRHGFTQDGLESLCHRRCSLGVLFLLCLVGVYQGAIAASLLLVNIA